MQVVEQPVMLTEARHRWISDSDTVQHVDDDQLQNHAKSWQMAIITASVLAIVLLIAFFVAWKLYRSATDTKSTSEITISPELLFCF